MPWLLNKIIKRKNLLLYNHMHRRLPIGPQEMLARFDSPFFGVVSIIIEFPGKFGIKSEDTEENFGNQSEEFKL